MSMLYKVSIEQDPETNLWVAEVPALEPCISFGETLQEAMTMIYEAVQAVIESKIANGDTLPDGLREYQNKRQSFDVVMNFDQSRISSIA